MNPLLGVMDRIVYVADGPGRRGPHRRGGHLRGAQRAVRSPRGRDPGARPGPGGRGGVRRPAMHYLFEPGLLARPGQDGLLVGTVVAITSGVIGVFTVHARPVLRRATRSRTWPRPAGPARSSSASTSSGGSSPPGSPRPALMEAIGVQRRRGRDVATGVVLGAALGAAALFLYLGTLTARTTGRVVHDPVRLDVRDQPGHGSRADRLGGGRAAGGRRALPGCCCSPRCRPTWPRPAACNVRARRHRVPGRAGRVGVAVRGGHRRGAVHRAADRPGRDRAAGGQEPGRGRWRSPR